MAYAVKPLACDPTRIKGMSEKLITSHYENNYGGAVRRLNGIAEQLAGLDFASAPIFLINGLKREELIATNFDDPARAVLCVARRAECARG
jgi:Fe-Mn family superoxide dismutase